MKWAKGGQWTKLSKKKPYFVGDFVSAITYVVIAIV